MNEKEQAAKDAKRHDVLLQSIAQYLKDCPATTISLLKEYKFPVSDNATTGELAKAVSNAFGDPNGKGFTTAFNQSMIAYYQTHSADGRVFNVDFSSLLAGTSDTLKQGEALTQDVGTLFGGKNAAANPAQAQQANSNAQAALAAKTQGQNQPSTKSKVGLYIGIAVAVIVIVGGVAIYLNMRVNKTGK